MKKILILVLLVLYFAILGAAYLIISKSDEGIGYFEASTYSEFCRQRNRISCSVIPGCEWITKCTHLDCGANSLDYIEHCDSSFLISNSLSNIEKIFYYVR